MTKKAKNDLYLDVENNQLMQEWTHQDIATLETVMYNVLEFFASMGARNPELEKIHTKLYQSLEVMQEPKKL